MFRGAIGEADFANAVLDMCAMTVGGKEGTEDGFGALIEAGGLELVRTWRIPGLSNACVEGRVKW